MTTHIFFQTEGIRVTSSVFPSCHSRPEDPNKAVEALNRMYNTDYTAALNNALNAFIPPDKALQIAFHFQVTQEINRAKQNAVTWVDQMTQSQRKILKIHLRSLLSLKITTSQRSAATFILNLIK